MTFGKASGYSEVLSSSFTQTVCYRQRNIRLPFLYLFLILPSIRYGSYQKQVHIETKELFGTKAVKVR